MKKLNKELEKIGLISYTLEKYIEEFPDDVENFIWNPNYKEEWGWIDGNKFMDDLIHKDDYIYHNFGRNIIIFKK